MRDWQVIFTSVALLRMSLISLLSHSNHVLKTFLFQIKGLNLLEVCS